MSIGTEAISQQQTQEADGPHHAQPELEQAFLDRLEQVFDRLRLAGIPFCILRNRDRIPHALITGSDVDLIVPAGTPVSQIVELMSDLSPAQIVPHKATLEIYFHVGGHFMHVDFLIADREWRGARYLANDEILGNKVEDGGMPVASPVHQAFCAWFSSLTRWKIFKPRYIPLIASVVRQAPSLSPSPGTPGEGRGEGSAESQISNLKLQNPHPNPLPEYWERGQETPSIGALLKSAFGDALGNELLELAKRDEIPNSEQLAPRCRRAIWRRAFARRPLATLRGFFRHYASEVALYFRPTGLNVAILGPDGAGKSTVAAMIADSNRAQLPFVKIEVQHMYERAMPRLSELKKGRIRRKPLTSAATHDPHGKRPHKVWISAFSLAYAAMDQWLSRILIGRRKVARNMLVLNDRHMLELLIDPKRFRFAGPKWMARAFFRAIPKPDLVILLDVPADVLQSRKQEVPFEETVRQRDGYRELIENMPNGRVVDANRPVAQVADAVKQTIVRFMTERTARRHAVSVRPQVGVASQCEEAKDCELRSHASYLSSTGTQQGLL